jgi:Spy/CpxP family protein refolding chaperone
MCSAATSTEMRAATAASAVAPSASAAVASAATTTAPRSGIGWKRQRGGEHNKRNTKCEF